MSQIMVWNRCQCRETRGKTEGGDGEMMKKQTDQECLLGELRWVAVGGEEGDQFLHTFPRVFLVADRSRILE